MSKQRIAIFRALYLGDLLCSAPAFRALREAFPGAEITLIGLPWAQEFVECVPYVDRLAVFPGYPGIMEVPYDSNRTRAFFAGTREQPYDLALQMHGSGQVSNGFVADLGARISIGYRDGPDERLSTSLPYRSDEHEARRWLRLVATLGIPADQIHFEFRIREEERRNAGELFAPAQGPGPLVGLHPGAKDPARRWPAERFAALGNVLVERYRARLVLTGNAAERDLTAALQQSLRYPALDLAGATDLGTFAATVRGLDLLVTNDTGASHIAAAVHTPSVILFGPSRPSQWAPLDTRRHRAIDALALAPVGTDPALALGQLPIAPVLQVATALLEAPESRPASVPSGRHNVDLPRTAPVEQLVEEAS